MKAITKFGDIQSNGIKARAFTRLVIYILKVPFSYQLKKEVSKANFNAYKGIYNCKPFVKCLCTRSIDKLIAAVFD